jgi:glutamine synthetase
MFEADGVFPAALIDSVLAGLRGDDDDDDDDNDYDDEVGDSGNGDADREELIRRHWHVG